MQRENEYRETAKSLVENKNRLALEEEAKLNKVIKKKESFLSKYYNIRESRELTEREHGALLKECKDHMFGVALKAIYITALQEDAELTGNALELAENMVDNYIKENGGATTILNKCKNKTYLLNRLALIVEDAAEKEAEDIENVDKEIESDDKKESESKEDKEKEINDAMADATQVLINRLEELGYHVTKKPGPKVGSHNEPKENDEKESEEKPAEEEKSEAKEDSKEEEKVDDLDLGKEESEDTKEEPEKEESKEEPSEEDDDAMDEVLDDDNEESEKEPEKEKENGDEESEEFASGKEVEDSEEDKEEIEKPDFDEKEESEEEEEVKEEPEKEESEEDKSETVNKDAKRTMFDELDKEDDVKKAIETIRSRVADAEKAFINRNAEDKKQIDELLGKISDNIKTVEDISNKDSAKSKIAQEAAAISQRKINEITEKRPQSVFEKMSRNLYAGVLSNKSLHEQYNNGDIDSGDIIESAKVMYGFLETINTLQIEKVDAEYIKKVLESM